MKKGKLLKMYQKKQSHSTRLWFQAVSLGSLRFVLHRLNVVMYSANNEHLEVGNTFTNRKYQSRFLNIETSMAFPEQSRIQTETHLLKRVWIIIQTDSSSFFVCFFLILFNDEWIYYGEEKDLAQRPVFSQRGWHAVPSSAVVVLCILGGQPI